MHAGVNFVEPAATLGGSEFCGTDVKIPCFPETPRLKRLIARCGRRVYRNSLNWYSDVVFIVATVNLD